MDTPTWNVLLHADLDRLQTELVTRIRSLKQDDRPAPVLVLAPTQRLVSHLRTVLARELGATLGLEVLHFQGLIHRRLTGDPKGAGLRAAPRALLEELVRSLVTGSEGELGAYAAKRPGAVRSLASLLGELREAEVTPEALESVSDRPDRKELAELYAAYVRALTELENPGPDQTAFADRAGLARRAGQCGTPAWDAVLVYGVYDLVGSNLALVGALSPRRGTTFLVPVDPQAPAHAFARDTVRRHLGEWMALDDPPHPTPNLVAARHLGGEGAPPVPAAVDLVNAQGPEAELTYAARLALRHIAAGVEPSEIAVVARSLERYAAPGELVFERHGIPVDSSLGRPARRHPKAIAFRLLLTALSQDFERQTVLELFRSPWFVRPVDPWPTDRLDRWARDYRLVRSAESWIKDLPRAVADARRPYAIKDDPEALAAWESGRAAEVAAARAFGETIEKLNGFREAWFKARRAGDHAVFIRTLAGAWMVAWNQGDPAGQDPDVEELDRVLNGILDDLESLDALAARRDGDRRITPQDALSFVESALAGAVLGWSDPQGVRFLDMMQARAIPFTHVILLGFNSGLFPRRARDAAFLPDPVRTRLRSPSVPLSMAREAPAEERLLLALTLAQAREHLTLSWLRADSEGKAQSPSPFLRDVAGVLPGAPTLRSLLESGEDSGVARVPTHPVDATRWHTERSGLVHLEDLLLATAHRAGAQAADSVGAVLQRVDPALAADVLPGLLMVDTIQEFGAAGSLVYDGLIPDMPGWSRPFSASSFDLLGQCPQKHFFSYVLGIRARDDTATDRTFSMIEVGNAFHDLMERVFKDLDAGHLLDGSRDADTLRAAADTSLDAQWSQVMGTLSHRMRRHLPGLWSQLEPIWRDEFTALLHDDLQRLADGGHTLLGSESGWEMDLDLSRGAALLREAGSPEAAGGAASVPVRVRLDRLTRDADKHLWITDYKTKGNLAKRTEAGEIIRGSKLQLALYLLMGLAKSPGAATAELMGIGPDFPMRRDEKERRVRLEGRVLDEMRDGLEETFLTLAGLVRRGRFPLYEEQRPCGWCDFKSACRHFHHPTRERVKNHPMFRDFYDTKQKKNQGKKGQKPVSLAAVRKQRTP